MRKELVYSAIALTAIPVTVNAAEKDVQAISKAALSSPTGTEISETLGTLVPGKYTFKGNLTNKVYGMTIKIVDAANKEVAKAKMGKDEANTLDVAIAFELEKATDLKVVLVSDQPGVSGAEFELGAPVVDLKFDFDVAKNNLTAAATTAKNTINGFKYAAKDEDVKAATDLITEIGGIKETYDDYKTFELYDLDNGTEATKINHLLSDATYEQVNFDILAIKEIYNAAVVDLKAELVDASAYLLDGALKKLSDDIDANITKAQNANYQSKQAYTAATNEAANRALIPTEKDIKDIKDDYKTQSTNNKTEYAALAKTLSNLQKSLNDVKVNKGVTLTEAEVAKKTTAQTKIDAVKALIGGKDLEGGAYNSDKQLTLKDNEDYKKAVKAAEDANDAYDKAVTNANGNQANLDAIAKVQKALNDAITEVNKAKSKDGKYNAEDGYYTKYLEDVQAALNKQTEDAGKAYAAGNAATSAPALADISTSITNYKENAPKAVKHYDEVIEAVGKYNTALDAARAQFADLDIYTAEGYDYKLEFDKILKDINELQAAVEDIIKTKKGADQWTDMKAAAKDNGDILARIKTLVDQKQSAINKYTAEGFDGNVSDLAKRIATFGTTYATDGDTKLGDDYAVYAGIESGIDTDYKAIKAKRDAVDPFSEAVDYTNAVDKTWGGIGSAGSWASPFVTPSGATEAIAMREKYNDGSCQETGTIISETINVENGTYEVQLYANANHANNVDNDHAITADATDVAYVFANGVEVPITAKNQSTNAANGEYTISNVVVNDGKLTIGLGKKKAGTNWHTIQIKSLKANTASVLEGWAAKLAKVVERQGVIEGVAKDIAAKVKTNTDRKSALAKNIDALQDKADKVDDKNPGFWQKYKLDDAASVLGNRGKELSKYDEKTGYASITKAEDDIIKGLSTLEGKNSAVDATAIANVNKTSAVQTTVDGWKSAMASDNYRNHELSGQKMVEHWRNTAGDKKDLTGDILKQNLTGLPNGVYTVELFANAVDQFDKSNVGKTDVAFVVANGVKKGVKVSDNFTTDSYTLDNVVVLDGSLELKLTTEKKGTNWHTIQIKALTYRDNSQLPTIEGYEKTYGDLAAAQAELEKNAPAIAEAVKANADKNTAVAKQMDALDKYELDNLKNKKNVSDANGDYDATKATVTDPSGWMIYKDDLKKDEKNYAEAKAVVDADILALKGAIATSFANETLVADWNDGITVIKKEKKDGKDVDVEYKYYIADIKAAIDVIANKADAEYANYWAYRDVRSGDDKTIGKTQKVSDKDMTDALAAAVKDLDKVAGTDAQAYYNDLVKGTKGYETDLAGIHDRMIKSLKARTAVADQSGFVTELKTLKGKIDAVQGDAKANLEKFNEQTKALAATKTLFNETYTNISTTDESELRDAYLKQLSAIQEEIAAAEKVVNESYPKGESVKNAQDFAALQNKITNVKTTQETGYIAQIQKENETAHANFLKEIEAAKAAYKAAADARANYRSSNDDIEDVIAKAAADLDVLLYDYKIIEKINAKVAEEAEAFAKTESPAKFDADNAFVNAAKKFETDLVAAKKAFMDAVTGAITGYWTGEAGKTDGSTGGFWGQLKDAKAAIAGLANADAKKDAFKDVEDILTAGDKAAKEANLAGVETAIENAKDITKMLTADTEAAKLKDINLSVTASETKYTATIEKLATYGDDIVNNPKKEVTDAINAAYNGKDNATSVQSIKAAKDADKLSKYDTYAAKLKAFLGQCDKAIETMDNAVKADQDNTKSYNAIIAEIVKIEDNLKTANDVVAQFKYYNDDLNANSISLMLQRYKANIWLENGKAKENETDAKKAATDELGAIKANLEIAISNEKLGLHSDITDLKNLYNQYVAQAGEDNATWKKNIADYEKALTDAATAGADFAKAVAAAQAILKIQNDIATLQSTIAKAYGNTANADVLASLNTSIATLEAKATIEGNDEWVKEQKLNGVTLAQSIADIQADIAAVKAEIAADEANIAFFKDKYEGKIADIETALKPVLDEIAAKQKQFNDDATAFAKFTAEFAELTAKLDAAKAKVDGYKYEGTEDTDKYDMSWYPTSITTWIKNYTVYQDKDEKGNVIATREYSLERMHELKNAQNFTYSQTYYGYTVDKAWLGDVIQRYLDYSAANEIWYLSGDLNVDLVKALDESTKDLYSKTVWDQLLAKKKAIQEEINDLLFARDYSVSDVEIKQDKAGETDWSYVLDKDNNQIAKDRTSDADYEAHKATVDKIAAEIADFASEVANRKLGDVSGNGKIDTGDYSDIIDIIIGNVEAPEAGTEAFEAADINGDGNLNVIDATQVVNIILYGNPNGAAGARGMEAANLTIYDKMATDRIDNANEQVVLNAVSAENGIVRLALVLNNQNEYSNLQMDFVLPEGMTLVGQSLSLRATQTHEIVAGTVNGMNRILVMSAENAAFAGNAGNLLFLDVKVDNNYKGGDILFNNVILTDAQANYASFSVVNGETTGINAVMSESISGKIYNVGGKLMNGLKKGINIIRRNDGTTDKVVVK